MKEWWSKYLELMIHSGLNKKILDTIIEKNHKMFREGSKELFALLSQQKIPLLIFSAGLGNIITGFLKQQDIEGDNIHILANFFRFDQEGHALGYQDSIIHTFNKCERSVRDINLKGRKNIVLLGDSLGDVQMSQGAEEGEIIRIGFLNENIEEKKDIYMKNYDVVICNDGTMNYVLKLLQKIILKP